MREGAQLDIVETLRLPGRWVRTRLSDVSLESGGLCVRNFPGRRHRFLLGEVDRFDWEEIPDGRACVLIMRDGLRTRVWGVDQDEPGATAALNNKLRKLRAAR